MSRVSVGVVVSVRGDVVSSSDAAAGRRRKTLASVASVASVVSAGRQASPLAAFLRPMLIRRTKNNLRLADAQKRRRERRVPLVAKWICKWCALDLARLIKIAALRLVAASW